MAEIVCDAGQDLGYNIQSDGNETYRAVSGGVSKIDELNAGFDDLQKRLWLPTASRPSAPRWPS